MLQFELEIVLIGIRTEADFLDDHLGSIGLHLLCFLFLLVQIFLVVKYFAHRRVGLGTYLHQVKFEFISEFQSLGYRIYTRLGDIVSDQPHLRHSDLVIDSQSVFVLFLILHRTALLWSRTLRARSRFKWCCDRFILL